MGNAYLLVMGSRSLLVDAGPRGSRKLLLRYLRKYSIAPESIELIVLTHSHLDHAGGLKEVMELTGSALCVHESEAPLVRSGEMVVPPGVTKIGRLASKIGGFLRPFFRYPPVDPDIIISGPLSLEPFGFPGLVLPTPGHTAGSLSVILENGMCFIGDSAANLPAFLGGSLFPPFAEDKEALLLSWRLLLDTGAKHLYPGHGDPFPASFLEKFL